MQKLLIWYQNEHKVQENLQSINTTWGLQRTKTTLYAYLKYQISKHIWLTETKCLYCFHAFFLYS